MSNVMRIIGVIEEAKKMKSGMVYKIYCPNMSCKFKIDPGDIYFHVRKGDTVNGLFEVVDSNNLKLVAKPFVELGSDINSIVTSLMSGTRKNFKICRGIYKKIEKSAGGKEYVLSYLDNMAESWIKNKNELMLFEVGTIGYEDMKIILNHWYKDRNCRRLYLLGLTKMEIDGCKMSCDKIYERCVSNPYSLPSIPLEKCDEIMSILGKNITDDLKDSGKIIKYLGHNCNNKFWCSTPLNFVKSKFDNYDKVSDVLKKEFKVVEDNQCLYLEYQHKIEKYVSEFISKKVLDQENFINKQKVTTISTLSDFQKEVVQGAIDHNICIITGGAGTGKCLGKGTKIMMADGNIKNVEDCKVNDLIMGPDISNNKQFQTHNFRRITSLARGTDIMYSIIINNKIGFQCNQHHILTLKSKCNISKFGNMYKATYYKNGKLRNNWFFDLKSADNFKRNFVDNFLFDIPLNQYIKHIENDEMFGSFHYMYVSKMYFENSNDIPNYNPYEFGKNIIPKNLSKLPDACKFDSFENRKKLLLGLLNYFGYKTVDKISLTIYNESLIEDIRYLASSLGYLAIVDNYNLNLYFGLCHFTIESIGYGNYYGFQLDGDGRFLLHNGLVTHNTTCIGQIVKNLELRNITYALCAFTGKAVSRMREVTNNSNTFTIHRLISMSRKSPKNYSLFGENKNFTYDHIIIDEASMVTSELFYDLIREYPNCKNITLVGDINQLEPIGWGCFFAQLIKSKSIPTYKLSSCYRVVTDSGDEDGIILNSNNMIKNTLKTFNFSITKNFNIFEGDVERVYDILYAFDEMNIDVSQIIVITPYNRWIDSINSKCQEIYHKNNKHVTDSRNTKWYVGDIVMLKENDYEIKVYNGERGTVVNIDSNSISVNFGTAGVHSFDLEPNTLVPHASRSVCKLTHAYSITVDKSQGSEWYYVVFFIPEQLESSSFLNKNRIYTAITRTKRACWCIVPDLEEFEISAAKKSPYRCENLYINLAKSLPLLEHHTDLPKQNNIPDIFSDLPDDYFDMGFDPDDF